VQTNHKQNVYLVRRSNASSVCATFCTVHERCLSTDL